MSYEYGRREAYAGNGASMPPPPPVAGSSYSRDGPSATYSSGYASSRDGGPSGGYSTGNDSYDNLSRGAPSGRYDKGPPASYERGYQEYGRPSSMTAASSGGAGASDYDRGNAPYAGQVHAPPTGYSDYPPGQYSSGKVYDERAHSGASYAADRRDGGGYYRQSSVEPAPRPSGYSDGASSYFARAPPSQYSSDRDRGTLDVPSHSSSRSGYPPAPEYGRRAEYGTSTGYERARTPPSYGDQYHQSQSAAPHQQQYQQQQQRSQHHQYEQSHHPRSDNHRRHDDYPSPPPRHHPQQHSHHSHPPPQDDHSRYPQAPPYSDSRSHHDSRDHTRERDDGRDHGRDYGRERGSLSAASVGHSTYRRRSLSPPSLSPSRRGPPPPPRGRSDRPEPDYSKWKHKPKSQTDPNFKPEMAQSLFVGNLPYHFTEEDLQTAFGRAGRVTNVALKMDPVSRQNKGFCFVRFASHEDAANAFHMYSKEPYEGRMFRLDWDKGVEQKLSQQGYTAAAAVASRRSRSRSPDHRHHVQHRQYQHQHQHRRHEADHHGSLSQSSVSPLSRRYRRSRSRSRSPTGHRRSSDRDGSSERTGHRQELSSGESVERKGGEEDSLQEKVAEEEADSVGEEAASMSKQASAPEEDKASDGAFAKAAEIDAGDAAALAILMGE